MSPKSLTTGLSTKAVMIHVGTRLRAVRLRAGKSQEAVAIAAGIHRTEVGLIERGKRMPRYDTILKLAGSLEVEPSEFFEGMRWVADHRARGGRFATRLNGDG
jgi:transcriptional regulator with XRE-family HTH domain